MGIEMCQTHVARLRQEMADRGLDHLVMPLDGLTEVDLMARLRAHVDGHIFDPLLAAEFAITANFLKHGGAPYAQHGAYFCPLCVVERDAQISEDWIVGCCNGVLKSARDRKLVPMVQ